MPTTIQFDQIHSITVEEDLGQVEGAVRTAEHGAVALATLTWKNGQKVLINVKKIRAFAETGSKAAQFGG